MIEAAAIDLHLVHKLAGIYASDETCNRHRQQKTRNRPMLEAFQAINERDQEYMLTELAGLSVSNPCNRRAELMVLMAGFENYARRQGRMLVFYTVTAPSKYHAVRSESCERNPEYPQEQTPRDTQRYFGGLWARIRAKLDRDGIEIY